jgi:integrase
MGKRQTNRLSAVTVNKEKSPGYYPDGAGLYLQISESGSKSWVLRFMLNKRAREMGLGSLSDRTLAEARERAKEYRQLVDQGIDPIEYRKLERERNIQASMQRKTFEQCAIEYRDLHASGWKNAKHAAQWINTLTAYAFPIFGKKDISSVNKADILKALEPIWTSKPETASRVRQRIRAVLDWAAARDYRTGHDPQIWDQVSRSLPKTKDIKKVTHFEACPYPMVYSALQSIAHSGASDTVKFAILFTVLTAARSGEVRGAAWSEIDFHGKRWVIPAERMKAGKEHRIPLSDRALEILRIMKKVTGKSDLVFPSDKNKQYSDMTFTMLIRRLGHTFTIHGFRSTFRDWAAEQTAFPREVCEAALAHSTKDDTEAAYFRSDLFEKRRQLMEAWATYCAMEKPASEVVLINKGRKA